MDKYEAILKLHPNVVTIRGDVAYDVNEQEVTYDEVAVQAEIQKWAYIEQRKQAYEPIEEQLDMLYWDKINGTNNWETMITTVKNLYPKPTE
jgi:hypothetical protein